ncbi:sialidase family protein [Lacipirellula limnantheis]|uniref:BNR/Asp-box repeat protein n=1 Tax=Lacipirellula limnantheis TaxID=2528024 RepID=A0A517U6K2_9BACT|nr:sialidase family protein [Lacipirellula limnantheis]QDT76233.1 BNR/Asp-box repeat protein [Lacipirellula limnantheis]
MTSLPSPTRISVSRILLAACVSLLLPGLACAELVIKPVFGPADPGGPYKHPAAIEELANGDLYIVFYGGQGEYEGDTAVYGSRLAKGTTEWTPPQPIADTPGRSDGNGVVWQEPGGPLWLFYVVRYGDTWSDSVIKYKVSSDQGETWSDSDVLTFERGMMVRSQPIQLAGGDILLPIYHETGTDRESVGADSASLFARYDKKTKEWSFTDEIHSRLGNIQPSVVAVDDDHLLAFCRRGGGYGTVRDGFMVRTESSDRGRTWSPGVDTEFPNPNAAIDLIKLANGHLALIYNDSFEGERMPLTMRISTDGGKTWPTARELVNRPGDDAAYPYIIQTADGKIHGVYTSAGRSIVNHFSLEEADVAQPRNESSSAR